jgi:hypothetical protein
VKRAPRIFAGLVAFVASSMLSVATPANAQPGGGAAMPGSGLSLDLSTLLKAKPGSWADYSVTGKTAGKAITIRYALVEHTAAKLALEIVAAAPQGEMVVHFDFVPQGSDAWKVAGGKIQLGEQKQDIPAKQLADAPALRASDSPGALVGTEDVTTPMGPLSCKHYKKTMPDGGPTIETWMNEKVSPTGLVKTTLDPMGVQQTLVATGAGAQSKLH